MSVNEDEDPLVTTAMTLINKLQESKAGKKLVVWLIVSIVLDVGLTVSLVFLAVGQHDTTNQIHNAQISACAPGNQSRAGQITLWNGLVAISKETPLVPNRTPAQTAENAREVNAFLAFVGKVFAPIDCQKLYP